jgi:hypothetical protein
LYLFFSDYKIESFIYTIDFSNSSKRFRGLLMSHHNDLESSVNSNDSLTKIGRAIRTGALALSTAAMSSAALASDTAAGANAGTWTAKNIDLSKPHTIVLVEFGVQEGADCTRKTREYSQRDGYTFVLNGTPQDIADTIATVMPQGGKLLGQRVVSDMLEKQVPKRVISNSASSKGWQEQGMQDLKKYAAVIVSPDYPGMDGLAKKVLLGLYNANKIDMIPNQNARIQNMHVFERVNGTPYPNLNKVFDSNAKADCGDKTGQKYLVGEVGFMYVNPNTTPKKAQKSEIMYDITFTFVDENNPVNPHRHQGNFEDNTPGPKYRILAQDTADVRAALGNKYSALMKNVFERSSPRLLDMATPNAKKSNAANSIAIDLDTFNKLMALPEVGLYLEKSGQPSIDHKVHAPAMYRFGNGPVNGNLKWTDGAAQAYRQK